MSHISQDLHNAFPENAAALRRLKLENGHFQALSARFDAYDEEVRRIDAGLEAASHERLEELKKYRLALLDEIAPIVAAAKVA